MGLSRDDAGRFLPDYVDEKKAAVFSADPFQTLDTKGVGMLMRWGIEQGAQDAPQTQDRHLRRTRRRCGQREVFATKLEWTTSALLRSACPLRAWRRLK